MTVAGLNPFTATDNPLVDRETGKVRHGGNFQAMSVTFKRVPGLGLDKRGSQGGH